MKRLTKKQIYSKEISKRTLWKRYDEILKQAERAFLYEADYSPFDYMDDRTQKEFERIRFAVGEMDKPEYDMTKLERGLGEL